MFLICGEALFDVFTDADGACNEGGLLHLSGMAGGSPFNVAVALSRLGCSCSLATRLSSDFLGQRLRRVLTNEGVDLAHTIETDAPTPLALISADPLGMPTYSFHGLRDFGIAAFDLTRPVDGIHVGSISITDPQSSKILLDVVSQRATSFVTFDPNVRLAVEPNIDLWLTKIEQFRARSNLIKVSSEDIIALYGEDCDHAGIASGWLGGKTRVVVLTRGAAGATVFSEQHNPIHVDAVEASVVDTVGAGDAFVAALICWIGENANYSIEGLSAPDLRSMASFAARVAAITCSRRGPDSPRRMELIEPQATH
jgi:fructokinase